MWKEKADLDFRILYLFFPQHCPWLIDNIFNFFAWNSSSRCMNSPLKAEWLDWLYQYGVRTTEEYLQIKMNPPLSSHVFLLESLP